MTDAHADTHHDSATIPIHLSRFLNDVWLSKITNVLDELGNHPDLLHAVDPATGMNALHIAVGRNNLRMTKILVEHGAKFIPDAHGRFPSVIAAEMEVSDELADYIVEAEANALKGEKPEGV